METNNNLPLYSVYFYVDKDWWVGVDTQEPKEAEMYTIRDITLKEWNKLCRWDLTLAHSIMWQLKERYINSEISNNRKKILSIIK